jgi:hypothetical protein
MLATSMAPKDLLKSIIFMLEQEQEVNISTMIVVFHSFYPPLQYDGGSLQDLLSLPTIGTVLSHL